MNNLFGFGGPQRMQMPLQPRRLTANQGMSPTGQMSAPLQAPQMNPAQMAIRQQIAQQMAPQPSMQPPMQQQGMVGLPRMPGRPMSY